LHPTTQQGCLPSIFVVASRPAKSVFRFSRRVLKGLQSVTAAIAKRLAGAYDEKKVPQ
jgi:hypothetical protein